jgi:hypothetical protein
MKSQALSLLISNHLSSLREIMNISYKLSKPSEKIENKFRNKHKLIEVYF